MSPSSINMTFYAPVVAKIVGPGLACIAELRRMGCYKLHDFVEFTCIFHLENHINIGENLHI
jgi:hypothetical protein